MPTTPVPLDRSAPKPPQTRHQEAQQPLPGRLWRAWQHIAAPLSYPIFVLGSLLMVLLVPLSMLRFRERDKRTRWLRKALHRGARVWVNLTQWLRLIAVEIDDRRTQPTVSENSAESDNDAPLLVIANHPSLIDILLISAALPNICCVLKGNLHYNPLFTLLIRHLDYLPNSDPERMLAEGQARLTAGERLLIFPEGTRTPPASTDAKDPSAAGAHLHFRLGAAELARRTGARTLPVAIHYRDRYLKKGFRWYRLPANIMAFRLEIGPILAPLAEVPKEIATGLDPNPAATRSRHKQHRQRINQRWIDHFLERLTDSGVGN